MTKEMIEEGQALLDAMKETAEAMEKQRKVVRAAQRKQEDCQNSLDTYRNTFIMMNAESLASPDPRTGRTNQEWTAMQTEKFLQNDPQYMKLFETAVAALRELQDANDEMQNLVEYLGMFKSSSRLMSSMLTAGWDV